MIRAIPSYREYLGVAERHLVGRARSSNAGSPQKSEEQGPPSCSSDWVSKRATHEMSSSGEESIMKRCDQCGGRLGMIVHRKWSWRFCKLTCKTAFMHRRHEEVLRRIRALVTMFGFPGSETSSETEHAGMPAKMKFVLSVLAVLGTATAALALTQSPDHRHSTSMFQSQDKRGVEGSDPSLFIPDETPPQRHLTHTLSLRPRSWLRRVQNGGCGGSSDFLFSEPRQTYRCR